MRRMTVFACAALCAAALSAASAPQQSDLLRIYNGLVKISSGRCFSIPTNGAAAASFMGSVFGEYTIWNPQLQSRMSGMPSANISILSSMLGDRVDFSVSGKLPAGSELAKELAAVKPVDPGLFKYIPASASVVYVSGVPGDSPLDRHALPIRAKFVEQLRAMMPPRATYRDFAAFAAPAKKSSGIALVFVFRLASAVPPLDGLAGKKLGSVFTLTVPKSDDDPPPDGFYRYSLGSSVTSAIVGSSADEFEETLRFAAAANGVMGPMTLECTCSDGYVFFDVGPAGDLAARLSRPESITFNVNSLLPLLRPDLSPVGIRTAIYASPSVAARRTLSGLGTLLKPVKAGLAPDGDGLSGVVATTPEGDFTWGWSVSRSELDAYVKNQGIVQNTFKTILMHAAHLTGFGGK